MHAMLWKLLLSDIILFIVTLLIVDTSDYDSQLNKGLAFVCVIAMLGIPAIGIALIWV